MVIQQGLDVERKRQKDKERYMFTKDDITS